MNSLKISFNEIRIVIIYNISLSYYKYEQENQGIILFNETFK